MNADELAQKCREAARTPSQRVVNTHPTMTRLAVNINEETQKQLRHLMDRDGITVTEAVRRLIGIGAYVDQQISDKGLDVVVHERNGALTRVRLLRDGAA